MQLFPVIHARIYFECDPSEYITETAAGRCFAEWLFLNIRNIHRKTPPLVILTFNYEYSKQIEISWKMNCFRLVRLYQSANILKQF